MSSRGRASRAQLADGRWHFQHGPIDLLIQADGDASACAAAIERAWHRFDGLLDDLSAELSSLRTDARTLLARGHRFESPVARRMLIAVAPFAERFDLFVTPMAAVAGAVAEHLIEQFDVAGVRRASINNGGDIALHLTAGAEYRVGIVADAYDHMLHRQPVLDAHLVADFGSGLRGIATSGWRGRSQSLGIADAVTVLAATAAMADAAATMIANRVDVDDPAIERQAANRLRDDSDLGDRLVTVAVGGLSREQIDLALQRAVEFARTLAQSGLIGAAALCLQQHWRTV